MLADSSQTEVVCVNCRGTGEVIMGYGSGYSMDNPIYKTCPSCDGRGIK